MPITYPLDFPTTLGLSGFELYYNPTISSSKSPFTKRTQTYEYEGEEWQIKASLPLMHRDAAEDYNAFLFSLRGKKGTFLIGDPNAVNPRGSWAGAAVVDGAGQVGDTINLKGFTPSQTNVIRKGDYLQIGTASSAKLYRSLSDANSDAAGKCSIFIAKSIRNNFSPADNAAIISTNARGLFRLTENMQGFRINTESQYLINFEAEEAI